MAHITPEVLERIVFSYSTDLPKFMTYLESNYDLLTTETIAINDGFSTTDIVSYNDAAPVEMVVLHALLKQMQSYVKDACTLAPEKQPDMFSLPGFWEDQKLKDQML